MDQWYDTMHAMAVECQGSPAGGQQPLSRKVLLSMPSIHIPLTNGKTCLIDESDYEMVSQYTWRELKVRRRSYATAYAGYSNGQPKIIYMHRLITNPEEGMVVDHINHNGLDNRRDNLRVCTQSQNICNHNRKRSNSNSGYVGVSKKPRGYQAHITIRGRYINVGFFQDAEEAARARDEAAIKYHGEFAYLNFPDDTPPLNNHESTGVSIESEHARPEAQTTAWTVNS